MGFRDRDYYRDAGDNRNPLMWLLSGSVPLFTAFGIRVRAHASLVLLIAFTLLFSGTAGGMGPLNSVTFSTALFGVILLHEFGHCFAGRMMGGTATDIMLWPLGGLAYVDAPQRWWPQFVTVVGGPAVNVLICIVTAGVIAIATRGDGSIPLNPLSSHFRVPGGNPIAYAMWFVFIISWGNFLFNVCIPVFPMDGGRILQALLWSRLGYYRATLIATMVGMVGAVLMAMWGLTKFGSWYGSSLMFMGICFFFYCRQLRMATIAQGPYESDDGIDYSAAYEIDPRSKRERISARNGVRDQQKRAAEERAEDQAVDAILAKVSREGMGSLNWLEKRKLRKITERQRERDARKVARAR